MCEQACIPFGKEAAFFVVAIKDKRCTVIAPVSAEFAAKQSVRECCARFLEKARIGGKVIEMDEIRQSRFVKLIRLGSRSSLVEDYMAVLETFGLEDSDHDDCLAERVYYSLPQARRAAESLLACPGIQAELERIFSPQSAAGFRGHPVHYAVTTNDAQLAGQICDLLIGSLFGSSRLLSRRYEKMNLTARRRPGSERYIEDSFSLLKGGAAVVQCDAGDSDSDMADVSQGRVQAFCESIMEYRRDVLTVLVFPRGSEKLKTSFFDNLPNITFVELDEEIMFRDRAKRYLKKLAAQRGVTRCATLYRLLPAGEAGCLCSDLNKLFERWYDRYIRTDVYPQYAVLAANPGPATQPKGDAYRQLSDMVGLAAAKSVIAQAIDYYKAQKLFKDRGIPQQLPAMHMCFTGNPGTAKTTAARLIAQIMKDNGLLAVGDLVEVGRSDLVGKYVGWTAQIVKDAFRKAKGSVLFIDEAYALVDDRAGLYGDEAINTIVQEMENRREDTVVIFAGYPDKMAAFLQKNPGLTSRIAFHIHFPDYSAEELEDIMLLMLKQQKLSLDEAAVEKARAILARAACGDDFGNGRFVRNMLEKARLRQASRLVAMDWEAVTPQTAATLTADDFEMLPAVESKPKTPLGFSA